MELKFNYLNWASKAVPVWKTSSWMQGCMHLFLCDSHKPDNEKWSVA